MFKARAIATSYLIFWKDEEAVSIHKDAEVQEPPPEKRTTGKMSTVS